MTPRLNRPRVLRMLGAGTSAGATVVRVTCAVPGALSGGSSNNAEATTFFVPFEMPPNGILAPLVVTGAVVLWEVGESVTCPVGWLVGTVTPPPPPPPPPHATSATATAAKA